MGPARQARRRRVICDRSETYQGQLHSLLPMLVRADALRLPRQRKDCRKWGGNCVRKPSMKGDSLPLS